PQMTNLIIYEYLRSKGVPTENIGGGVKKDETGKIVSVGKYTPFGQMDYRQIVSDLRRFAGAGKTCVISTLNGDTNLPFFKEYSPAGLTPQSCPVVALSISEDDFRALPANMMTGQYGCWSYFQSIQSPANAKFVSNFQQWLKKSTVPGIVTKDRVTCSP